MFDRSTLLRHVLDDPQGSAVLEQFMPGLADSPMVTQALDLRLGQLVSFIPTITDEVADQLWAALAALGGEDASPDHLPAIEPDPGYERDDVPRASARLTVPTRVSRWGVLELRLDGPSHGNPFCDVELGATFSRPGGDVRVGGFYDGDGVWKVRALADVPGEWSFVTTSTARSLDGLTGSVTVGEPEPGAHGPVHAEGFGFRYADGTRHRPVGTTAYAWTHQSEDLQQRTLATLAASPFTKLRMCVFPKSYQFNSNEPADFPFPGTLADGFDLARFDPAHFRRLETRIAELAGLGIEADLILFHAYDRWGFADLGPAVDDRYVRYVVRRLGAFANVWWSMANEYDLVWSKSTADWERLAGIVAVEDPAGHLCSIHNCAGFYDHSRPWVTHVSAQRTDAYKTSENVGEWRETWGKPVVVDECAYEGDIDQGWGNISGEELVRRCWEGAVRGGYVGHGETYLPPADDADEVLWWAKGGELHGTSPQRLGFLDRLIGEAPDGVWEPLPSEWDVPWGGVPGEVLVGYFGFNRPRFRTVVLPEGEWTIEVIDTWAMTVEALPGTRQGTVRVLLPGREYVAVRCTRV